MFERSFWASTLLTLFVGLLPPTAHSEDATINFRDVEIVSAIESISLLTGKTFIVDPRVQGKISIIAGNPIDSDTVYDVFISAMNVQGFQAISDGNVVRILPSAKAPSVANTPGSAEFVTEIVPIRHGQGQDYIPVIKPLIGPGALITYHKDSNSLIISDSEVQVNRFKLMILDLEKSASKSFEIIGLKRASAVDVVSLANQTGLLDDRTTVIADKSANTIIVTGPVQVRRKIKELVAQLDLNSLEGSEVSGVEVILLEHAQALDVQPILDSLLQSAAFKAMMATTDDQGAETTYAVQADKANNALVIAAPASVIGVIRSILSKLDRPRAQVLIEAIIAEVSEDFFNELSVNLAAVGNQGVFLADFDGALSAVADAAITGSRTSILSSLQGRAVIGGEALDAQNRGFAGLLKAIRTDSKNMLLSTPSILTLDNEEATIAIAKEIPFVTGSYTSSNNGATNPFQTIERKEVGTILKVKPQIGPEGSVRLAIEQEVSNIDQSSVQGGSGTNVTTDKKTIETDVVVGKNQTLVLGGLIDRKFSTVESKVPILGDLPLFGPMFRGQQKSQDTSVLMVFIRPTVVTNASKASVLSESRYELLYGYSKDFVERNSLEGDIAPLPESLDEIDVIQWLLDQWED